MIAKIKNYLIKVTRYTNTETYSGALTLFEHKVLEEDWGKNTYDIAKQYAKSAIDTADNITDLKVEIIEL